ncbi:MAG TPA: hypothetical protein VOA88_20985 [Candidatus Dormibacteraeota bacterium]|nr:hypothetical protein [Candidatus Dormibacteraeota bacterium]
MSKARHVFDVLQNHFEKSAERHIRNGNRAKAASDHLRKCFTKAEMGDSDDNPYSAICDLLDELVGEYADAAASDIESCKECSKAIEAGDLAKLVPTAISAVVPTAPVRAVPRAGQREIPLTDMVEPQFRKLVEIDEGEEYAR